MKLIISIYLMLLCGCSSQAVSKSEVSQTIGKNDLVQVDSDWKLLEKHDDCDSFVVVEIDPSGTFKRIDSDDFCTNKMISVVVHGLNRSKSLCPEYLYTELFSVYIRGVNERESKLQSGQFCEGSCEECSSLNIKNFMIERINNSMMFSVDLYAAGRIRKYLKGEYEMELYWGGGNLQKIGPMKLNIK